MRTPLMNNLPKLISDNLPQILSAVGMAGVVATAVLAVKGVPAAEEAILEAQKEKEEAALDALELEEVAPDRRQGLIDSTTERIREEGLTILEVIRATWKPYLPASLCAAATIACIAGANHIGLRRHAALLGAYTIVDQNFRDYRDKVMEHVTPQKAQKMDDELMAEKIRKNPPTETFVFTGGDQLCYESWTGRYFKSTAEKIRRAAQDLDARMLQGDYYASLNDFFRELDLETTSGGEMLGWNIHDDRCRIKVVFSTHLNECDQPCLAVGYENLPIYNYDTIQ